MNSKNWKCQRKHITYSMKKVCEHPLLEIMLSLVVSSRPVPVHQAKRLLWVKLATQLARVTPCHHSFRTWSNNAAVIGRRRNVRHAWRYY